MSLFPCGGEFGMWLCNRYLNGLVHKIRLSIAIVLSQYRTIVTTMLEYFAYKRYKKHKTEKERVLSPTEEHFFEKAINGPSEQENGRHPGHSRLPSVFSRKEWRSKSKVSI
jgi:hypothetical protein